MTIGEMAQQLAQVRAYYREQGELEQQDVCRNMLASRIDALRLNRCRVAASDLHGNGLPRYCTTAHATHTSPCRRPGPLPLQ